MAKQQEIQSVISLYGKVDGSISSLSRTLQGIGKTASDVGGAISMLSAPIIAAGKASISLFTNYDDVMKSIQAVGGYTASEMEIISEAARKAGAQTRFMATDAGNAFLYLTQAGVDMEGTLSVLPSLLNAAAAGQMDLATTSDLLISNIYSLGKSFSETDVSGYVDAVTMAADATNTNLEEIMAGVSKVGAAGRMFGGGTNELLTFMGLLSNLNLKGETGGVNARNMIISLLAPTDKAGKVMEALAVTEEEMGDALDGVNLEDSAALMHNLGLETTDAEGKVRPMIDILTDLDAALAGMADDEKADVLYTIFGKRTYPAVAGLLEILDLYPEILEQVENSMGSAEEKAAIMESGIGGTTRRLKSAFEEIGLAVGSMASPTVMGWMEWGRDVILDIADAIDRLDPDAAANVTGLLGGIAVAGPGLVIAGKAIEGVGKGLGALTTPTGRILAIGAAFGLLAWSVNAAQDAAARKSLNEHFGSIEVDAEKMQGIIAALASDFETRAAGLSAYAEAIGTASTSYQTAVSALSGGLLEAYLTQTELNETDKQSLMAYASNIQTSLKEALGTQKLRVGDIIDMSFDGTQSGDAQKNAGWDALAVSVFGGLEAEAHAVGEKLREQMVAALKDNTLDENELEAIRASQARMNEIMAQISKIQGDFGAKTAYNRAMLMSYDDIDTQMSLIDEAEKVAKQSVADSYASLFALVDLAEEQGTVIPEDLQKAYGIEGKDYAGARSMLHGDYEKELTGANLQRNIFAARIAGEAFNAYGEELNGYYAIIDQLNAGKITLDEALKQGRTLRKESPNERADEYALGGILADMAQHLPMDDLMEAMRYQLDSQGFTDTALSGLYRDYLAASLFTGGLGISKTPYAAQGYSGESRNLWYDKNLGALGQGEEIEQYAHTVTLPDGQAQSQTYTEEVQATLDANPGDMSISIPDGYSDATAYAAAFQAGLSANPAKLSVSGGGSSGKGTSSSSGASGGLWSAIKSSFGFAEGGRATVPSVFGEAGPEWAIPEEHTQRTAELLASAARASGFSMKELTERTGGLGGNASSRGGHFVYSPTIYASDARGVQQVLDRDREEMEAMFDAYMRQRERVSYA